MQNLLKVIINALVDDKDAVEIKEVAGAQSTILEIKVSKLDVGKIIGRQGRTADAIRTIINCAAAVNQRRYILQIIDDGPMDRA